MNIKHISDPNTLLFLSNGGLTDLSGKGNNATNVNSVTVGNNGRFSNPFVFNNTNYLTIANPDSFKLQEYTIHAIAKISNISIILNSRTRGSVSAYYGFALVGSDSFIAIVNNSGGSNTALLYNVNTSTKYNLISATFSNSNSNRLRLYFNGELVGSTTQAVSYRTSNYVGIGRQDDEYTLGSLNLDTIIVKNVEQSQNEIRKFYNQLYKPD